MLPRCCRTFCCRLSATAVQPPNRTPSFLSIISHEYRYRRGIFCIVMGVEDNEDCLDKLVRAVMLKHRVERKNLMRRVMECLETKERLLRTTRSSFFGLTIPRERLTFETTPSLLRTTGVRSSFFGLTIPRKRLTFEATAIFIWILCYPLPGMVIHSLADESRLL